ncbi:MAG: TolC family protein [Fibrobacter sp.]|nr:TolC family protein [Fibrobacter sp.]
MNVKIFSVIMLMGGYVFSQDNILTLSDAIKYTVTQNTSTQLSINQIDQRDIALKSEKYGRLPDANASLSSSMGGKLDNKDKWNSSTDGSISASYTYTPSTGATIKSLKAQSDASRYSYKQTVNDLTASAVSAYIKAAYARKTIAIAKNDLDYQKAKLTQIEEFKNAGKKSISDVLQQQTAVAESEASLLTAEQNYSKAMLSLYNIAGIDIHSTMSIDTNEIAVLQSRFNQQNSDDLKELLIDSIPQIQSQQQSVHSSQFRIKSMRLAYVPSIRGTASTSVGYGGLVGEEHDVSDPTGRLSLSLSYPLFDQYKRKLNVSREKLSLQSAQLQLTELERKVVLQYEQYNYDLQFARKQLTVAQIRLTAAKQSLDAINERYNAGASTLVEVAMVNTSYLGAVNSQLSAESSLLSAYVNLLQVRGDAASFFNSPTGTR